MKHNGRHGQQRPIPITNMRGLVHADPIVSVMSPQEALGSLVQLEPYERGFFGQLIAENWANGPASLQVDPNAAQVLRSILAVREFDAKHLTMSNRDPFALIERYFEGFQSSSETDHIRVTPSARGLALVESLITGAEITY